MTGAADRTAASPGLAPLDQETARAKLNLALHVLGRRGDGYHDLASLVVFADVGDELSIFEGRAGLEIDGPFAAALSDTPVEANLVMRSVAALSGVVPTGDRRLRLVKNIPVGTGLGGGSADAAAVLRMLLRQSEADVPPERLDAIAPALGADVPMCVRSLPLVARGKGERLTEAAGIPSMEVVLAWPGVPVSTAEVFSRVAGRFDPPLPDLPGGFASVAEFIRWLRLSRNGLEDTARDCAPVIGHVLQALTAAPGCMLARMSGSGSACFGIFPFRDAAEHAARIIRAAEPGWWVVATRTGASPGA